MESPWDLSADSTESVDSVESAKSVDSMKSVESTESAHDSKLDSAPQIALESLASRANTLSPKQQNALDFILSHEKTLLFGDTGSGKTEIYIHAIIHALQRGQNVLFLMPEISLTPQMERRLKEIFGDLVCMWHSKISRAKKTKILAQIHAGRVRILAGARSALFVPLDKIGLIIVDEEHDDAYKASANPRYNARDLAIYLSAKRGIRLILGSATPSPNSYFNFHKDGAVFRLKGRHFDSSKTLFFERTPTQITQNILDKIATALESHKQIIVFVPIRANFKTLLCQDCGQTLKCRDCSVSMSIHSKQNALICHYCGKSAPLPKVCPHCGGEHFSALKYGTQEIARLLGESFPNARIAVFDRDEITTERKLKTALDDFNKKRIDILVGTQMLSKGHDYHNVALVVILGIDYLLFSSDFRAFERAMSLFHQISGRCARKEFGEVIIQTQNVEFFKTFSEDYEDFLRYELAQREGAYPPFRKLAFLTSAHKDEKTALARLESCKKRIESHTNIDIIGLSRAPIERVNGQWRYCMLLKSRRSRDLLEALHALKDERISIDIDPLQLL